MRFSTQVKHILRSKGAEVWSAPPDRTVFDALKLMAEKNVGALPVIEGGKIVGMFSERDYARKVILLGRSSREIAVRDIMSTTITTVSPDKTIEDCMAIMTDKKIRHLPVIGEGGDIAGIVSIGDIVKSFIEEQEFLIRQLEAYITGSH